MQINKGGFGWSYVIRCTGIKDPRMFGIKIRWGIWNVHIGGCQMIGGMRTGIHTCKKSHDSVILIFGQGERILFSSWNLLSSNCFLGSSGLYRNKTSRLTISRFPSAFGLVSFRKTNKIETRINVVVRFLALCAEFCALASMFTNHLRGVRLRGNRLFGNTEGNRLKNRVGS